MQVWQAIILGAIQGFSEFLPISSSGHLILFQKWFNIEENVLFYSVALHFGTLIPVVTLLRKEIKGLFYKPFGGLINLVIATVPAGIIGLTVSAFFDLDGVFTEMPWLLSLAFLLTAIELIIAEKTAKKNAGTPLYGVDKKRAFIMGIGQGLAVIPGLSRSGTTSSFGTMAKVEGKENAEFTFLMSLPIILSALFLETLKCFIAGDIGNINFIPLAFGVITSAVTGYIAVSFMLKTVAKANYKYFALYLCFISVVTLITSFRGAGL